MCLHFEFCNAIMALFLFLVRYLIHTLNCWWMFALVERAGMFKLHNLREWNITMLPLRLTTTQEHPGGSYICSICTKSSLI